MICILVMQIVAWKLKLREQGTDHSLRTEGDVQVLLGAFGPGTAAAETTAVKAAAANNYAFADIVTGVVNSDAFGRQGSEAPSSKVAAANKRPEK